MWWYQCRNISGCFLSTMKRVSPNSGSFDSTNIHVQNPHTRSCSMKLQTTTFLWSKEEPRTSLPSYASLLKINYYDWQALRWSKEILELLKNCHLLEVIFFLYYIRTSLRSRQSKLWKIMWQHYATFGHLMQFEHSNHACSLHYDNEYWNHETSLSAYTQNYIWKIYLGMQTLW